SFNTLKSTRARALWRVAAGRPRKSLYRNDLRPDGQHANEQRKRRQGGGFFDHGPDHVLVPPYWTERERCSIFVPELSHRRGGARGGGGSIVAAAQFELD